MRNAIILSAGIGVVVYLAFLVCSYIEVSKLQKIIEETMKLLEKELEKRSEGSER